eukprot:m.206833 g.206833  ORF g.206833 m.206833 type:complete len:581 (+) comp32971_c0_seq1:135-1877(+)
MTSSDCIGPYTARMVIGIAFTGLLQLLVVTGSPATTTDAMPLSYPPMHWHSWNTFCAENEVNATNMMQMADALVETGMAAAGYDMVNVVCNGWTGRDPKTGVLQENKALWPNGIRALANYLHAKQLKLGCYTSPAVKNCCGEPGSLGYEYIDMETFAQMGCDHVMVDWCHAYVNPLQTRNEYAIIGAAIANSSNPNMMYGIWPGGMGKSWKWGTEVGGAYWRVSDDISNSWSSGTGGYGSVLHNFDVAYSIPEIASKSIPGHFTFLDQMVVGVHPAEPDAPHTNRDDKDTNMKAIAHTIRSGKPIGGPGLSLVEAQAHMTMWVMAASPLLTCNDVRNMTADILEILTNPEVLAVHKDPLAKMAIRVDVGGGVEEARSGAPCSSMWSVYQKDLNDGSFAVMVLNRDVKNISVDLLIEDVGDSLHTNYAIRDLWRHQNLTMASSRRTRIEPYNEDEVTGALSAYAVNLEVASHGVRMLRLWPLEPTPKASCPMGYANHTPGFWWNTSPCPQSTPTNCSEDSANGTVALCATKCDSVQGCKAFEVFSPTGVAGGSECYLFVNELQSPFSSDGDCTTCVKNTQK